MYFLCLSLEQDIYILYLNKKKIIQNITYVFVFTKEIIQSFILSIITSNYTYGYHITGMANMNMFASRTDKYNIKSLKKFQSLLKIRSLLVNFCFCK